MCDELLDISVREIMRHWPGTIRVFVGFRLYCVGCPIGAFHTLRDAAAEHNVDLDRLSADVKMAIRWDELTKVP